MNVSQVTRLHEYLERTTSRLPDKAALVCGGERVTWAQIDSAATALACALRRREVERGDRVVICLENSVESCVAVYGVLRADAVFSLLSPQTKAEKLRYVLLDSGARCLVVEGAIWDACRPSLWPLPELLSVLVVRTAGNQPPAREGVPPAVVVERYGDAVSGALSPLPDASISIDLASIVYTSGSTGDPKGVMLTHQSMVAAAESITTYLRNRETDVVLNVLPMSFDYGLYQWLMVTLFSGTLVLERSFSYPMAVLAQIDREGITGVPVVPTIASVLRTYAKRGMRYEGVRYVTNTAAALSVAHIETLRRTFPNARVYSMYGLTECKRVCYLPPDDLDRKPTSVGRPMPNMEVFIATPDGRRAVRSATGELVVRGPQVMRGYWRKPAETAEWLKPGEIPGEFHLWTGDQFRADEEGYLYFLGRSDDIIKSRGEKVSPREVENVIYSLEGVKEVAIVGVPDDVLGDAVHAFVVLDEGATCSAVDIIQHCTQRLENFMVPKYVTFLASIPKTSSGKILTRGIRELARSAMADQNTLSRK